MNLYEYQKELIESKEKNITINWCRGAGKTTALAVYILEHYPKIVNYIKIGNGLIKLVNTLQSLSFEYNCKINKLDERTYELLHDNGINTTLRATSFTYYDGIRCNLLISDFNNINYSKIKYDKSITSITKNNFEVKSRFEDKRIVVDYKRMLKANPSNVDLVDDSFYDNEQFLDEFAILNKKEESLTFIDFRKKAMKKLMKQFLLTPDTKDTVLTRKNIIEMIKDLNGIK